METFPGHPLFDNAVRAIKANGSLDEYPTLKQFLDLAPEGALRDWEQAQRFLISYASTSGTYSRFRGEIQRFLLFLWLQQGKTLLDADDEDINQYMGFIKSPPASWIGSGRFASFIDQSGVRVANEKWRPFFGNTEIKQATLDASKVCLQTFFRVLVSRRYLPFSPMAHARKSAQRANRSENGLDDDDLTAPRLTDWQWAYLLESLLHAASQDAKFERHLFVVVTMKTLYLRVHELAPRKNDLTGETYQPTMGDFRQKVVGSDKYWAFYVWGKGSKERLIPLPAAYMPYLIRYRESRGLSPYPAPGEMSPIVGRKIKGREVSIGKRQIERTVEQAINIAADRLEQEGLLDAAKEMRQIAKNTHYLRHTGASMDIEAGRPIRHVSEDLGHESVAFTESVYINADSSQRYETGHRRKV